MADRDASWRVVIADVSAMPRVRAVMVLGRTELTLVDAIELVSAGKVRAFRSSPMTRRRADRIARSALRHGGEARVEAVVPKGEA